MITCGEVYEKFPDLMFEVLNNIVLLRGNVKRPGIYLVEKNFDSSGLVSFAGELKGNIITSLDRKGIEVVPDFVKIVGAVRFPTKVLLEKTKNLSDILSGKYLLNESIYPLFGIIHRTEPSNGQKSIIPFNPEQIFNNESDVSLMAGDKVQFFEKMKLQI